MNQTKKDRLIKEVKRSFSNQADHGIRDELQISMSSPFNMLRASHPLFGGGEICWTLTTSSLFPNARTPLHDDPSVITASLLYSLSGEL